MTTRPQLEPGLQLAGRYHLRVPLGRGGAATVWRADDDVLDRPVAVKLLHPELERDSSAVVRFRREATSAASLTHPNAVVVYDIGEDAGRIFLVMELVDGPTLSDLLSGGRLPPAEVAALGGAVSRALGAAHDRSLVHRDVKPGNVLVTREGVAKMADFGIATALGDAQARLTTPGMVVGTSTYLAPEQLSGDAVDGRADIYSLGLVLFECLTGEPAFSGGTAVEVATRRLAVDVPAPSSRIDGVPEELDLVVQRATRRDPAERWEHGADLAAALLALAPDDGVPRLADLISERIGPPAAGTGETTDDGRVQSRHTTGDGHAADGAGRAAGDAERTAVVGVGASTGAAAPRDDGDDHGDPDTAETTAIPRAAVAGANAAGPPARHAPTGTVPAAWDDEPEPEGAVAHSRRRPWRGVLLGVVVLALAGFALVGLLGGDDALDFSPEGGDGGEPDEPVIHEIAEASDWDPFGDGEHPDAVGNAVDGDPDTTWQTQRYNSAAFGNLKPGVGIYFDLGDPAEVREVALALAPSGADLQIYAADEAPSGGGDFDPDAWGEQVASVEGADGEVLAELDEAVQGRVWLVWFTSLPADGGGHRVTLSEVELRG